MNGIINFSDSLCGANSGSNKLQKQLRRSCAVSYSTATSEDDCQSERDFSIYSKPRLVLVLVGKWRLQGTLSIIRSSVFSSITHSDWIEPFVA